MVAKGARMGKRGARTLLTAAVILLGVWALLEIIMRLYVDLPLKTDFYGSISRDEVRERQAAAGVKVAAGPGWIHLGWIADPERESYRIEWLAAGQWTTIGHSRFGSFLWRGEGGAFRVFAVPKGSGQPRLIGEVS
ncbi:MAG: hypothetical protein H5T84_05995, partial [Thermoleophilia bacterium]|nr:hypothetical protein [Thermoleophilia bacterium]